MEKSVTLRAGSIPAPNAAQILTSDQLLHTWDLAKALGRPYQMDEDLAAATLEGLQRRYDPAQRGPGKGFAERVDVPENASTQDKLIALSGRVP